MFYIILIVICINGIIIIISTTGIIIGFTGMIINIGIIIDFTGIIINIGFTGIISTTSITTTLIIGFTTVINITTTVFIMSIVTNNITINFTTTTRARINLLFSMILLFFRLDADRFARIVVTNYTKEDDRDFYNFESNCPLLMFLSARLTL